MLIGIFFQFLLSLWSVNLLLWEIFQFLHFLPYCYDTVLVPTAESWFLCTARPFYHSGNSLVQYCWKVLCALFAPYYLGSAWSNVLCVVCTLFIPYCLGNFLVQCYWIALCALFILYHFLENSYSHFILERLCFLCMPFFCHFLLGPSALFPSKCLLCVSLALSLLAQLCCLPIQLGHLPSTSFVGMTYRNLYWSILFLVLQLLPFAFWTSLLEASSCTSLLYLKASFRLPLAWSPFIQLLFATFILGFFSRCH